METLVRRFAIPGNPEAAKKILSTQWLITNGLGGYASGTVGGRPAWRYHGLLIAALPAPYGRMLMLNHVGESIRAGNSSSWTPLGCTSAEEGAPCHCLTEFRCENQIPIWRYELKDLVLEKRLLLLHRQNTLQIQYHLLAGPDTAELQIRPFLHFRPHEGLVHQTFEGAYTVSNQLKHYEISAPGLEPVLRLALDEGDYSFVCDGGSFQEFSYAHEADRGFESRGVLWSPGGFRVSFSARKDMTLVASTEPWNRMLAITPSEALEFHHHRVARLISLAPPKARGDFAAELVLAADQFIIEPVGRIRDAARAHASGEDVRTVIAGYHWFTDWGRDTMISLEGLTLSTGRHVEAAWILRTFANYVRDGLIPNMFPEGKHEGLYHTADATLWFFHALDRYVQVTGDRDTLRAIVPKLLDVAAAHLKGTRFGIHVDPADGLLVQGEQGYQLTWMDAKVDDWVVTPRRGKAVEINALWYNALRLLEEWLRQDGGEKEAQPIAEHARQAQESFNRRFWCEPCGHLFDVIDGEQGDDNACRPNQVLAISLKHPVLANDRWKPVLNVVRERLLTPVGLRSLSPDHKDFKAKYFGHLRARDAAYHQGTVWAWLIGPFIDAWLKTYPEDRAGARKMLEGFTAHLNEACVGSISEIFDAQAPFTPRGCIAQAWSVAEALRCWVKTSGD